VSASDTANERLLPAEREEEMILSLVPLLRAVHAADTPFMPEEHPLFQPALFPDAGGKQILVPQAFHDAAALLLEWFGPFYTFHEIRAPLWAETVKMRNDPSHPIPDDCARAIIAHLNHPLPGVILTPATFFVPLCGVNITAPIPLGTATIVPVQDAEAFRAEWGQAHCGTPAIGLPKLNTNHGTAYAQADVGHATSERQDELVQRHVEDAVNLLRYWQHHIGGFQQFNNRPHIGHEPPSVHAVGFGKGDIHSMTGLTLYQYSIGTTPIGADELRQMRARGLAAMIAWQDAPPGTARAVTLNAARRMGYAWSLFNVEDRIAASFSAFEGWLRLPDTPKISETIGRRLAVLIRRSARSEDFAKQFSKKIYGPIRSAVAHGEGLRPEQPQWIDRVITSYGVEAILRAIPMIRSEPESWLISDFHAELDGSKTV